MQGKFFRLSLVAATIIISFYLFFNDKITSYAYQAIWLLPLAFTVSCIVIFKINNDRSHHFEYTLTIFIIINFLRLVITPIAIHLSGPDYNALEYIPVPSKDISKAIYLIFYETISATFFIYFFSSFLRRRHVLNYKYNHAAKIKFSGSRTTYSLIAALGAIIIVIWGIPNGIINFISIREGTIDSERSPIVMLAIQIMTAGAWLSFLLIAHKQYLIYQNHPNNKQFIIAIIAGIIILMLIFGDRRSIQIYTSVAVGSTLLILFPQKKKKIIYIIALSAIGVVSSITLWRMFLQHDIELNASLFFNQSSIDSIATALQSYIGGPYQIAAANILLEQHSIGLSNLFFDFLRSTFIINLFVKDNGMLTSQIMNFNIYDNGQLSGWLIFTTSYSYAILGIYLVPLFLIANLAIAMLTENTLRNSKGIEVKFLFTYLLVRIMAFPYVATPLLISFYSMQLLTIGLIILTSISIKRMHHRI